MKLIGLIRQRNEDYLLEKCLKHALIFCDHIIIYDDYSNDKGTLSLLYNLDTFNDRITVVYNSNWNDGFREADETKHRQILLDKAREFFGNDIWLYYFDADEVVESPEQIREQLAVTKEKAFKVRLFDAYALKSEQPYINQKLWNFRKYFGPEYRDIIMFWKNSPDVNFLGIDKREPEVKASKILTYCQHYGKALSEKRFEDKCDYYIKHFSKRYQDKWRQRKGFYYHNTLSDFGRHLITWKDARDETKIIKLT
jgi:hypothetical protein